VGEVEVPSAWLTLAISAGAAVVSIGSLVVSTLTYRASGPRVSVSDFDIENRDGEWWLQIRVINSGRSEVDVEAAWTNWLGPTASDLPHRMKGGSSKNLIFKGVLPPLQYGGNVITVQVGLGSGRNVLKQIRLNEFQQGQLSASRIDQRAENSNGERGTSFPVEEV
jgi:hypothetical protein